MIAIAVAVVLSLAAIQIANLKYSTAREAVKAVARIDQLEANLKDVDWEHFKILREDVQALHNINSLGGRR